MKPWIFIGGEFGGGYSPIASVTIFDGVQTVEPYDDSNPDNDPDNPPYLLRCWGSAQEAVACEFQPHFVEASGTLNWRFKTREDRYRFKRTVNEFSHGKGALVCAEYDGPLSTSRTVAHMELVMPDGRVFPYTMDFGYGYPEDSAHYMWEEGNYECDCNRSLFLKRAGHDVEEMDCGAQIAMQNFRVEFVDEVKL